MRRSFLSLLASFATLALASSALVQPALACSCVPPAGRFVTQSGALPSDAVGVVWSTGYNDKQPSVHADKIDGAKATPVAITTQDLGHELLLLRPTRPMKPGEHYRFTSDAATIDVTIDALALGPLLADAKVVVTKTGRAPLRIAAGASCSDTFDTDQAKVLLALPDAAKPYLHALLFETTVDGAPWSTRPSICQFPVFGRSAQALAEDIVFSKCGGRNVVGSVASDGPHQVALQASLPGTTFATKAASAPLVLSCQ